MKIVASSPGDIVVEFAIPSITSNGQAVTYSIPVKSISATKTIDVSKEYGTGSHQDYAEVVGKIGYEGDFTIGTWWVSAEDNPQTWDDLVRYYLTYPDDEGLPREFEIRLHARAGTAMVREGTGIYGAADALTTDNLVIERFTRCILKGDGVDVGEPGSTVSRKYPFSAYRRDPL